MTWRLATSLIQLRSEINDLAPNRNKASDGTIGDTAHASRCSRHNPNKFDVVTALDITHDPKGGCDIHTIARQIAKHPHPQLAYILSNRQSAGRNTAWAWQPYKGANPHTVHAHFGVGEGNDCNPLPPYDSIEKWGIKQPTITKDWLDMASLEDVKRIVNEAVSTTNQPPYYLAVISGDNSHVYLVPASHQSIVRLTRGGPTHEWLKTLLRIGGFHDGPIPLGTSHLSELPVHD